MPAPLSLPCLPLRLALLLLLLLTGAVPPGGTAHAAPTTRQAEHSDELINWYYAAVFGTGVYTAGDRTVGVVQLPFAYTLRAPSAQRWGLKLTLPLSFGFYDFDLGDLGTGDVPESVSTASVLPGIEFEIQALRNWRLQPFAAVGYGWELDQSGSAVLYHMGVRSQLWFPLGSGEFMLGNTISHAGYDASNDVRRPLSRLITGLNFSFPTNGTLAGRPFDFGIHFIHYLYLSEYEFPLVDDVDNRGRDEFELAFSLSTRDPIPVGAFGQKFFNFDRVGLAFRAGEEVTAIRLFFSLPY